ncbi:MAG: FAD-dependent protein, partial [Burkholderiaceae bacterium]
MLRLTEIKLPLDHAPDAVRAAAATVLGIEPAAIQQLDLFKRSFDARKAELLVVYTVDLELADPAQEATLLAGAGGNPRIARTPDMRWQPPVPNQAGSRLRPVVVGFGPCGIFAALALAQLGLRPIVLERGRDVRLRTRDTWGLWRRGVLDPESNVQFGEGGAGTFSDGKLYSQIRDPRWLGRKVMNEFVAAGAPPEILVTAHPHIGTFKLVKVVERLRAQIHALGGEVRFEQRVTDLIVEDGALRGLLVQDRNSGAVESLRTDQVVMALGHSARDTFEMLHARGVAMVAKPFSIGFRIEHPQSLIDRARWGRHAGHPALGAADYKLVHHVDSGAGAGRSVYSFCMCPGGTVVAATSEAGRVATNGMSQYSRNERNANAAIVVGIEPADFAGIAAAAATPACPATAGSAVHPLAGIALQRVLESRAFELGGGDYRAPGQRVGDFLAGRATTGWGAIRPSYQPGVRPIDLAGLLPDYAIAAIRSALPIFGRQIKGFDADDAVLTAVETRTSSPLRIARGEADLQSPTVRGLYP